MMSITLSNSVVGSTTEYLYHPLNTESIHDNTVSDEQNTEQDQKLEIVSDTFESSKKKFICDVCQKTFSKKHDLIAHHCFDTKYKPFSCHLCPKAYALRDSLKKHLLIHIAEELFKCDYCEKTFKTKSKQKNHMFRIHRDILNKQTVKFVCKICLKVYDDIESLKAHFAVHTDENLTNKSSYEQSTFKEQQEFPVADVSEKCVYRKKCTEVISETRESGPDNCTGEKTFICNTISDKVQESFSNSKQSKSFINEEKGLQSLGDGTISVYSDVSKILCNQGFKKCNVPVQSTFPFNEEVCKYQNSQLLLVPTEDKHDNEKFSSNSFGNEETMLLHDGPAENCISEEAHLKPYHDESFLLQNSEMPFKCGECPQAFNDKVLFENHLLCHEKPYACDLCPKRYCFKQSLMTHVRVHSSERPFTCDECGKAFRIKQTMLRHIHCMHEHDSENFTCDICPKVFALESDLKKHKIIHTDRNPYKCDPCKKSFKTKSGLNFHRRRHHSGIKVDKTVRYVCEICRKVFIEMESLKVHFAVHVNKE